MRNFLACVATLVFLFFAGAAPIVQGAPTPVPARPALVQAALPNSLTVKVEPIGSLKLDSGAGAPWWTYTIPAIGPIFSGLLALVGVWFGLRLGTTNTLKMTEAAQKNTEAAIWQKANETELRDIQAKLDEFYIPFQLQSRANHQFAQDIRSRQDEGYRMLVKLFDVQWRNGLPPGDAKLVEIVCKNAEELRALIASKSGLVDDKILPYLSRVSAHFRILHLAYESQLGNDATRFMQYVYPRELDPVLGLEIARLKDRIEQLRSNPGAPPPTLKTLEIPPNLKLTEWVDPDGRMGGTPFQ
jgi:hypothetical protein